MTNQTNSQMVKEKSWAKDQGGLFSLANFIHKYRIFRFFQYTPRFMLTYHGILFGKLVLRSRKLMGKLKKSLKILFPEMKKKRIRQIIDAHKSYMGMLLIDAMLYSPNINYKTVQKFISYDNIKILDEALKRKKGAIIVSGHIGWFFHTIAGLVYHPNAYDVMTNVQPANMKLYEFIVSRPEIKNILKLVPTDKYQQYKPSIIDHLKNNGIFLILHDYSRFSHMKMPFWKDHSPLMIATPNSAANLSRITGAEIIVAIPHPDSAVGKTRYEFFDSQKLTKIADNMKNRPEQDYYEAINTEINANLAPYFQMYAHVWEELPNFFYRTE